MPDEPALPTRRRSVRASLITFAVFLLATVGLVLENPAPSTAAPPAPPPAAAHADTEAKPLPGLPPGDDVVVGRASPDGYLIVRAQGGAAPTVVARLAVNGIESSQWIGTDCRTGSGRYVAVAFGPQEGLNSPAFANRGALGAVVDLVTGQVHLLGERVALKYHSPGCGPTDEITFARYRGDDGETTELLRVDGHATITERVTRDDHLSSPAPTGSATYAAAGNEIVDLGAAPQDDQRIEVAGQAFGLVARSDGGIDALVADGEHGRLTMLRADRQRAREVAQADYGHLQLRRGRHGTTVAVGSPSTIAPEVPLVATATAPDAVSLDGSVSVSASMPPAAEGTAKVDLSVTTRAGAVVGTTSVATDAATAAPAPAAVTAAANVTTPKCAVPRNDPSLQVMQPSGTQVEWAVDQAVRNQLNITRPPFWNGNGVNRTYSPQAEFKLPDLVGGGRIPAQVLLGVLAQESNLQQAGRGALPGVPANPLVADYYGAVVDGNGRLIDMDYANADCGYGIGQITDGMTASSTLFTPEQKRMIATDYAANIAAAAMILANKWNETHAMGLKVNGDLPAYVENWYFALWAYNTGLNQNTGSGRYGVGWTNNPANSDWKPDRKYFLRATYDDAAHPQNWPYVEKVMGWAEQGQFQGTHLAYTPVSGLLALPTNAQPPGTVKRSVFCTTANECDPAYEPGKPANYTWAKGDGINTTWYCKRPDRQCWWHWPVTLGLATGTEIAPFAGQAEPAAVNPHPPSCTPKASAPPAAENIDTVLNGAVIVDDVQNMDNIVGCSRVPSGGTFQLAYGQSPSGGPLGAIDFHQIGAGYGGHFWYGHTVDRNRTGNAVTGTWTPPSTTQGWTRVMVHIPDHGADTYEAEYKVNTGTKTVTRIVNQRWNKNSWVDLGIFQMGAGANVSLSNATNDDWSNALAIDVAWDAVAFQATTKPTVAMVALGDSYSAGEGDEPYYPDADNGASTPSHNNACHRSPSAYAVAVFQSLAAKYGGSSTFHFAACSGAIIDQVSGSSLNFGELPQLNQGWLDENTTNVTMSIGGNDARFAAIIKGCILTITNCIAPSYHLTLPDGTVDPKPLIESEPVVVDAQQSRLEAVLAKIKDASHAPNAKVVLVGYPHVIYSSAAHNGVPGSGNGCIQLDGPVAAWMATMTDRFDEVMRRAATNQGALFYDPRAVFDGHEACSPTSEWINATILFSETGSGRIVPGSGSFHPKPPGHAAEAPQIVALLPATPPASK